VKQVFPASLAVGKVLLGRGKLFWRLVFLAGYKVSTAVSWALT
jgi:hypothetical protein